MVVRARAKAETAEEDDGLSKRRRGTVCAVRVRDDRDGALPRRGPRGISYDHPAASASLGPGDQTNRLPIALPIIGAIDTARFVLALVPLFADGRSKSSAVLVEEARSTKVAPSSGFSPARKRFSNRGGFRQYRSRDTLDLSRDHRGLIKAGLLIGRTCQLGVAKKRLDF